LRRAGGCTQAIYHDTLSSAEAPVSKHQRKKRERERWREKTGARGTMGRAKKTPAKETGAGALERENGSAGNDGKSEKAGASAR